MNKYEIIVGFEETGRIQFFGYPKRRKNNNNYRKVSNRIRTQIES